MEKKTATNEELREILDLSFATIEAIAQKYPDRSIRITIEGKDDYTIWVDDSYISYTIATHI